MRKNKPTPIFYQLHWGRLLGISLLIVMMLAQAVPAASLMTWDSGLERPLTMDPGTAANSIVRVEAGVEDEDGKYVTKSTASGFIVCGDMSNVYVVTALSAVDLGADTIIHVVIQNDSFEEATINSSEMSREKGFCVLTVPNSFNDKNVLPLRVPGYDAEGEELAAGDEVTALGFPAGLGSGSAFKASDVNGAAGKITKTAADNNGIIETDIAAFDGAAGGPLIDKDGYAVGLVTKAGGDNAKITAIDITDIEAILDSGDYAVRTKDKDLLYNELCELCDGGEREFKHSSGEAKAQIQSTWQNAVAVLQNRPCDRKALKDAIAAYKEAVDNAHNSTPVIIKLLAVLLGLVIIVLLIRLISLLIWNRKNASGIQAPAAEKPKKSRKKKAGRRGGAPQPVIVDQARQVVPLLVSLRTGAEIALNNGRITFGRGDASDIKLASRMVSSQHASVQNIGGTICLFDLGSTNGTYVNNIPVGREGARLMPGDIIRFADEEFRFIVR